jgi:hypothetical protein
MGNASSTGVRRKSEKCNAASAICGRGLTENFAMIGSHSVRHGRNAFFALLSVATVAMASSAAAQDGAPARMVTFFNAAACPTGWNPVSIASGRLLLASTDPAKVGVNVNAPLGNLEDRTHKHGYSGTVALSYKSISAGDSCCNPSAAHTRDNPLSGTTNNAPSGLPFVQLLVCERAASNPTSK